MPALKMNARVQLAVRQAECEDCRMCADAQGMDRCVTASGSHTARVMVVGKKPWGEKQHREILTYLIRAGFHERDLVFTSATKCRTWETEPNRSDIKSCRQYLRREIDFIRPRWVLALGNEAMLALTGKSGIMKHRGITYPTTLGSDHKPNVISSISPAMVYRNPGQKAGFEADMLYFYKMVMGRDVESEAKPKQYFVLDTKEKLKRGVQIIRTAHGVSFDIESTGFDEFDVTARIVCISFTVWGEDDDEPIASMSLPLYHPESPWRRQWRHVVRVFYKAVLSREKRIAHNGKFDCRWLRQFGWKDIDLTFDTMLAAHTLDENRPKGLEPLSRSLLNTPPWKIDTSNLVDEPLAKVLDYCARDTWQTARLYFLFKEQFRKPENARKTRLFARLMMPAANEFIAVERAGVWVDRQALNTNWRIAEQELKAINDQLRAYVPNDHPFVKKYKTGRPDDIEGPINFGPSNFLRWFVFKHLHMPVLARGKTKDNGDPGSPSLAEEVMLQLKGRHPAIDLLLARTKWYKYTTAFFSAYSEQLDPQSRIHTNFKVTGTVTGRLSSGKADADKVTSRKQVRGVNLQQVPRDNAVRGIFGAPPGSSFVEFDYSQVELRIAAHLSQEKTMLNLYAQGADIHMAMAMRLTGKPQSEVSKHERKMAKAVNFGFLYGMGWAKFIKTALNNYELVVSEQDARAARVAFFAQFPGLLPWHARQRALAAKYKRVETPLGRVRHLPDIDSPDQGVRAEAERQAINSPVQGLASDLALLSFVLVSRKLREQGFKAHAIGTVHDAINFEAPNEELARMLPLVKDTMENLPLRKFFGIKLDVPIIADAKIGRRWGGATEVPEEVIYDEPALRMWLRDHFREESISVG